MRRRAIIAGLLAQTATWKEIQAICDDGMKYGCASVCIPASYVKQAAEYVDGKLPICTVIGFPNGYDTTAAKCFMATDAVENGAEEGVYPGSFEPSWLHVLPAYLQRWIDPLPYTI